MFEEGDRDDPKWTVMSRASGRSLVSYYPKSGKWYRVGGSDDHKGVEGNWRTVFAKAKEFDRP